MSTAQLQLIHSEESWKLDQHTITVGRAGIAAARAALATATSPVSSSAGADPIESVDGQMAMALLDRAA